MLGSLMAQRQQAEAYRAHQRWAMDAQIQSVAILRHGPERFIEVRDLKAVIWADSRIPKVRRGEQ